jgi:hypothetical protein
LRRKKKRLAAFCGQPRCALGRQECQRYKDCLAVSATTMEAAATVNPAPMKAAAVEPASTMEAATAVKALATVESTAAEAATKSTATLIEEAAIIETAPTTEAVAIKAAMKETISAAEAKAASETKPRSSADKEAAVEPVWAVVAVRRAGVRIIIVVAVIADWLGTVAVTIVSRSSEANTEGDALGARIRGGEKANSKKNTN